MQVQDNQKKVPDTGRGLRRRLNHTSQESSEETEQLLPLQLPNPF